MLIQKSIDIQLDWMAKTSFKKPFKRFVVQIIHGHAKEFVLSVIDDEGEKGKETENLLAEKISAKSETRVFFDQCVVKIKGLDISSNRQSYLLLGSRLQLGNFILDLSNRLLSFF